MREQKWRKMEQNGTEHSGAEQENGMEQNRTEGNGTEQWRE